MRPQFHFTADGWINDPHGITYAGGKYHLFFQYVPGSTSWQLGCSWGHASGRDLFSLDLLPPALEPGDGDDGVWSGSLLLLPDGSPRIFYTSVSEQDPAHGRIRTAATTDPDWVAWEKGPVVAEAADLPIFRDPVIVPNGTGWQMLVGAGLEDGAAAAIGFSSPDGVEWRRRDVVTSRASTERDPLWAGSMWECPQIIEVDGRHALIVSVWGENVLYDVVYALGEYANETFTPQSWGRLSHGPSPYAATTFRDETEHPCLLFWLRGVSGEGWTGAHSIPYRLAVTGDQLSLTPHPDLERYRDDSATSGTAADIVWPAEADASIQIVQDGDTVLSILRKGDLLRVRVGDVDSEVPWEGDVRLIVDGAIVELSSRAAVFASPIRPLGEKWELVGSGLHLRRLRHPGRM
jgi:beta-fructofuranosidase